jgi:hypothetical protein
VRGGTPVGRGTGACICVRVVSPAPIISLSPTRTALGRRQAAVVRSAHRERRRATRQLPTPSATPTHSTATERGEYVRRVSTRRGPGRRPAAAGGCGLRRRAARCAGLRRSSTAGCAASDTHRRQREGDRPVRARAWGQCCSDVGLALLLQDRTETHSCRATELARLGHAV